MNRALVRLIVGQVFVHACMAGMRMAAPLWALNHGWGEATVGMLVALFALTQVFIALPAGRFADRHGFKRPMRLSVIAATIGAVAAVAWPSLWTLGFAALLTGGATGASMIALQRHVGKAAHDPVQLKQVFSWLAIGPAIANFLGPFVAGLLIDHAGFRFAFGLMAALPLVCWAFVRGAHELAPDPGAQGAARTRAWDLWREPVFRRLLLVNWILASCWDVHTFVVPVLGHERGLSASAIGTILGAFAIAAALVRVFLPLVAQHLREWALIASAMLATATLFAIYPLLHAPVAMGLCSVLLGLALGTVQPMIMSMLHQITPGHRHGEAIAMRMLVINASSVAMPLLFGAAGSLVGVAGVFWAVGAMVGTGSRLAFRLRDDRTSG